MMQRLKQIIQKNGWVFLGGFCLLFFVCSAVSSQSFNEIRRFLTLRDSLEDVKTGVEKLLTSASDAGIQHPEAIPGFYAGRLAEIEAELDAMRDVRGPLAEHYRQMLGKHIGDVKMLLPVLQKKFFRPIRDVVASPTAAVAVPVSASALALIPPTAASVGPEEFMRRKKYFHPISPRQLLLRTLGKSVVPISDPVVVKIPATVASSTIVAKVSSATSPAMIAVATIPSELPPPVGWEPPSMTPIQPPASGDLQIRQSPGMRPLAVMIENHNQARPQTGIGEAEVVYEIPVEGGITRFMALFYHVAGIIGPVRSCRDYFIDRALEVNALYVHCGGSPQGYQHIANVKALAIDEISSGEPFFRDNTRKAPHNLYSRMQKIIDYMNKKFPMELPYQRLPLLYGGAPTYGTALNKGVTIRYHGNYSVTYRFSTAYDCYDRYMNGQQHLDRVTFRPVSPGAVVIQEAAMKTIDEKGRQDISFIGSGKGYLMAGGTVLPITWQKAAPREFTRFSDGQGKPVIFSNGRPIWIQVVSPANTVVFDPPLAVASAAAVVTATAKAPAPAKEN